MDIFKYADSIGWAADYMDMHTGLIYAITRAYTDENGKKVIPVYENGILIGTTTDNRQQILAKRNMGNLRLGYPCVFIITALQYYNNSSVQVESQGQLPHIKDLSVLYPRYGYMSAPNKKREQITA